VSNKESGYIKRTEHQIVKELYPTEGSFRTLLKFVYIVQRQL